MYFEISLNSIQPAFEGRNAPLMLELVFRNTVNRQARVLNYDLEIWHKFDFLGALRFDFQSAANPGYKLMAQFQPQQQATMRFLWHYVPASLNTIEEVRKGGPISICVDKSLSQRNGRTLLLLLK